MLNKNKSYIGLKVEIFSSKFDKMKGRTGKVIEQHIDDRGNVIFGLNIQHPKDKKTNFWVKETEVKVLYCK